MEYLQYNITSQGTVEYSDVLNLIINGIPSIHLLSFDSIASLGVLNLIINGIPSILRD